MSSKPNIPVKSSGDTFSAQELNTIVDFFENKPDADEIPEAIDGKSAYQLAVDNGYVGSKEEWLESLKGHDGQSAYSIAVENGYVGTEEEWIESLSPVRYMDGDIFDGDGETPETKTTIKDGSIGEEKLSEEVRGKLNSEGGSSEILEVIKPIPPDLVTDKFAGQLWSPAGQLTDNAAFGATNKITTAQSTVFTIQGLTTINTQMGRFFNSSGVVVSNILPANLTPIFGGHRLKIPEGVGITHFGLNVSIANLPEIIISEGEEIILEEVKAVKENLINLNAFKGEVFEENNDLITHRFSGYYYNTSGVLQPSASLTTFNRFTCTSGDIFSIIGVDKFAPTTDTNTGRFLGENGDVISTFTLADLLTIYGGQRLIVPNNENIRYFVLWFNNTLFSDLNKIEVRKSNDATNFFNEEKLPKHIGSEGLALRYFNKGKQDKTPVPLMPGFILAGQSNQDGRIDLASLPSFWTDNGNKLTDVLNINTDDGIWHEYNETNYVVPSSTPFFSYELLLLKLIIDHQKSIGSGSDKIYTVKHSLGGSSIYPSGAGSWFPDFDMIPTNTNKLLQTLENRIRLAKASEEGDLYDVKALIWHQGESDGPYSQYYYQNLKNVIYYIRGVVGKIDLPVILGGINNKSNQYNGTVEDAKIKISEEDSNVFYAEVGNDLSLLKADKLHFNLTGGEDLSNSIFQIMVENEEKFFKTTP